MTDEPVDDDTPLPAPLAHHVADPTRAAADTLDEDAETVPAAAADAGLGDRDTDDELTSPRGAPRGLGPPTTRAVEEGPLFAVVPAAARAAVLARFTRRAVAAGATVIRQGELGHALIVVVRGRLQLRADRADGLSITLGYVRDGEFIGEGSLLARTPSPIHAVATEACELLALAPRDALDLAGAVPAIWAELKDAAQRRARTWDAQLARRG